MSTEKKELKLTCKVDSYRSGWTVVEFLSHRFKYHTASGWERRVRDRQVMVNAAVVAPDHVVARGDAVQYTIWHAEPEVDYSYDVLYEDKSLVAVSKSGNIPVHACGVFITHTLIARLKEDFGYKLNLAHRLDRETSGAILLCKDRRSNRAMAEMFRLGKVAKSYLAVVYGSVPRDVFEIDAPIGKIDQRYQYPDEYAWGKANDLATYLPKSCVDVANGKPARTIFEVRHRSGRYTVLRAVPKSGRTNQIRVHLAHAGFPIVGDKIYALEGELREEIRRKGLTAPVKEALVLDRHALHCESLRFDHPVTGENLLIQAPPPPDLLTFWK
jgi:23S rRNA pseudouridine1911/1915/1917 synthase